MTGSIVFVFSSSLPSESSLSQKAYYDSYQRLAQFAQQRNIDLRLVFGTENYDNGFFKSYWKFKDNKLIHVVDSFKAGIVYLKTRTHLFDNENRVNNAFLESICRDKYKTAQLFSKFTKKTVLIDPANISSLEDLTTDLIVLKPRYGSEGRNVQVLPKESITPDIVGEEEFIAQEFIDSSGGITGIVSQSQELRLYIFNGKIQSGYLRLPTEGSYLSNISQGATVQLIEVEELPVQVFELKNAIDAQFKTIYPRLYTIDLMFENQRPWLVEINDTPGMPDVSVQPLTDNYLHDLLDLLSESIISTR